MNRRRRAQDVPFHTKEILDLPVIAPAQGHAMTSQTRISRPIAVFPTQMPVPPRVPLFRPGAGAPALVRERLDAFAAAFAADIRPGLVFEFGRLVLANDAARTLLRSAGTAEEFLSDLKTFVEGSPKGPVPLLSTRSGTYTAVLYPARCRQGQPTRLCFLIKRSAATDAYKTLSKREQQVLRVLVHGLTNRQIAEQLSISIETVRKHIARALAKTGTPTRTALVGHAPRR